MCNCVCRRVRMCVLRVLEENENTLHCRSVHPLIPGVTSFRGCQCASWSVPMCMQWQLFKWRFRTVLFVVLSTKTPLWSYSHSSHRHRPVDIVAVDVWLDCYVRSRLRCRGLEVNRPAAVPQVCLRMLFINP